MIDLLAARCRSVWSRWLRCPVRFRIATVAATVTVLCLVSLAQASGLLLKSLLVDAADQDLHGTLGSATVAVAAGRAPPARSGDVSARVLDRAGDPVDASPRPPLDTDQIAQLTAGRAVLALGTNPPRRWLGEVVTAPNGDQRLVAVGAPLVGYAQAGELAMRWSLLVAALGGAAAGAATWLAARTSLRPVQRMRRAAAMLPPGERLPVPKARDELTSLAEAINALLARRDEARARLQRFTGDAAHELRSPVASIRAQAEVAVLHPDPTLAAEVLSEVVTEAERLSALIDDLLVLSRSDAGELPPAGPVDLGLAAQAAIERAPQDGPRLRLVAPPTQSCSVWAASAEVDLVLDNLLRNAFRHARARVTVSVLPAAGGGARLVVDDDGHGVPAEHRALVFERFYRVDGDRGRGTGGFGLGLALVAEVVRRRRGTVAVAESPELGARFEVRWPGLP